jgi:hypothetical protein
MKSDTLMQYYIVLIFEPFPEENQIQIGFFEGCYYLFEVKTTIREAMIYLEN